MLRGFQRWFMADRLGRLPELTRPGNMALFGNKAMGFER
jgi:hypothetical protein